MKYLTVQFYESWVFYSKFDPLENGYDEASFQDFLDIFRFEYESYMTKRFNENIYNYEKVKTLLYSENGDLYPLDGKLYSEMFELVILWSCYRGQQFEYHFENVEHIRNSNYSKEIKELPGINYGNSRISDVDYQENILVLELDDYNGKTKYIFEVNEFVSKIPWKELGGYFIANGELFKPSEINIYEYNLLIDNHNRNLLTLDIKKRWREAERQEVTIIFSKILSRVFEPNEEYEPNELHYNVLLESESLVNQKLDSLNLWKVNLSNQNLSNSHFKNCTLSEATLTGANLNYCKISGGLSPLYAINLDKASLRYAILAHAQMRGSSLQESDFSGANLVGAYLYASKLYDSNFENAELSYTDFSYCGLHGANLNGENLHTSILKDAMFDETTIWPKGFDPIANGARVVPRETAKWINDIYGFYPIEVQRNAEKHLSTLEAEYCDLLIKDNNSRWNSVIEVLKNLGYPRNKKAIIKLFSDSISWIENLEFFDILKEVREKDKEFLISLIENCVKENEIFPEMLYVLKHFLRYAKLAENDFIDKAIFELINK